MSELYILFIMCCLYVSLRYILLSSSNVDENPLEWDKESRLKLFECAKFLFLIALVVAVFSLRDVLATYVGSSLFGSSEQLP